MASHDVALKVATELPVGAVDLEIPVKRGGRKIGTFTVNANGVSWNPATAKAATSLSWEELPAALAGTSAAAPAPARKTAAKKTAAKKAAPAPEPSPASSPAETTAEAPAPEADPTARKTTTAKKTSTPKTSAARTGTAKKAAPAATAKKAAPSATAAVDARAVRTWAAENGIVVAPRGPISSTIIDQFRAAQS